MKDLMVFDIDGVLIDVSLSYRDVVRKSALLFFKKSKNSNLLPDPLFSLSDLAFVKQSGGLNNDWDLTKKVLTLLFTKVTGNISETDISQWDVKKLAEYLSCEKSPLEKIFKESANAEYKQIDYFYKNDIGSGNIIKQIFQEIYLGSALFFKIYNLEPEYYNSEGYILREKFIVTKDILEKLNEKYILAIATGRPEIEAWYPLEKNGLKFFETVLTYNDCLDAENQIFRETGKKVNLGKPNPFMLDRAAERIFTDAAPNRIYYIGDMPDDMIAAKSSSFNYKAIGVTFTSPDKQITQKRLEEAGADYIIDNPEDLLNLPV